MRNREYWQKRFSAVEEMRNKRGRLTVDAIAPHFDRAQASIDKEIRAWYQRFADNNEISVVDAKKLLRQNELEELQWDVSEYIKRGRENAVSQEWLKELENASAKFHISRLEALKLRTQNAAEQAFAVEQNKLTECLTDTWKQDYYHTAYEMQKGFQVGFDVAQVDNRRINKLLDKPWTADQMTFSDRIWKSKAQLLDSVSTELTQMCILGKAPDEAINNIAKRMHVAKSQAGRLVMTENAYFGSAAQKQCYQDLDVEQYQIVATLDSRTSDICRQLDGKVFDMKDYEPGVTAPPFHVYCRTCTVPYFADNDDNGMRAARDENGKTYYVPANTTYAEWEKAFAGGGKKAGFKKSDVDLTPVREEIMKKNSFLKTEQQKAEFQAIVDNMNADEAGLYKNMMGAVKDTSHYYDRGKGWYVPSRKRVEMDIDAIQWDGSVGRDVHGAWKVKLHEESHQLDHVLASMKSPFALIDGSSDKYSYWSFTDTQTVTGKRLIKAMDDDILNMINKAIDWDAEKYGTVQKQLKSLGKIPQTAKNSLIMYLQENYPTAKDRALIDTVTDAIGMSTGGKIHPWKHGFWGHPLSYCKSRKKDCAVSEMWANMNAFLLRNDTEAIEAVAKEMPLAVKEFTDVHNEIVEYSKTHTFSYGGVNNA